MLNAQQVHLNKLDQPCGHSNKDLRKYNWIFLHPYCQVLEINKLKRIVEEKTSAEENKIFPVAKTEETSFIPASVNILHPSTIFIEVPLTLTPRRKAQYFFKTWV